jgi:hypothetical protein
MTSPSFGHAEPDFGASSAGTFRVVMPPRLRSTLNGVLVVLLVLNTAILLALARTPPESHPVDPPSAADPLVVTDREGQVQLTLTSDWIVEPILPPGCVLTASQPSQDLVLLVFAERKSALVGADERLANLDGYSQYLRELLAKSLQNATHGAPARITIDGLPAVQAEVQGTTEGRQFTFLHTVVEAPDAYYQVRGVALSENFAAARQQLAEITASCRVLTKAHGAR